MPNDIRTRNPSGVLYTSKSMNYQKSPVIIEWNRAKQIRNLVILSCLFFAILAALSARLAYLATN